MNLFRLSPPWKTSFRYLIYAVLLTVMTVCILLPGDRTLHRDRQMSVLQPCTLTMPSLDVERKIRKGEMLTVLAVTKDHQLWVETTKGERGFVPFAAVTKDDSSLGDSTKVRTLNNDGIHSDTRVFTVKSFESRYMGKKYEVLEADGLPAIEWCRTGKKDGAFMAKIPARFNSSNGRFYEATVTMDADSTVIAYGVVGDGSARNAWLVTHIGFYAKVAEITCPLFTEPLYYNTVFEYLRSLNDVPKNGLAKFGVSLLLLLIAIIFSLLRWFMPAFILPFLIYGLAYFPALSRSLPNYVINSVLRVLFIICAIFWGFICLANINFIIIIIAISGLYYVTDKICYFENGFDRCEGCAMQKSYDFDHDEVTDTREATEVVERRDQRVVTSTHTWQTYDLHETWDEDRYGQRHNVKSQKSNVQNHKEEHGFYIIGKYREHVQYITTTSYYYCRNCHKELALDDTVRKVLSRERIGESRQSF